MDEALIVKQLQQRMPQAPPPSDSVKSQAELTVAPVVQEVMRQDIAKIDQPNDLGGFRLLDFFEVPHEQWKHREVLDKLNYIYNWGADKAGSDDSVDILTAVRELERQLGVAFSDRKMDSIWRWLKLDESRRRTEKEMALIG